MGENTFGALFGPYMAAEEQPPALAAGIVENMDVHHSSRWLTVQEIGRAHV